MRKIGRNPTFSSKPIQTCVSVYCTSDLSQETVSQRRNLFIAPPSYNACKPGGDAVGSSDEEEDKKRADGDNEEDDEDGTLESYAPKCMTYKSIES